MKAGPSVAVLLAITASVIVYLYFDKVRQYKVPTWLTNHPVNYYDELVPKDVAEALRQNLREYGPIYTNNQDTKYYEPLHEDVGEAEPLVNGGCRDMYKIPNKNRTKCILPGRIDVGRHYILTGGPDALKEKYESLVSRLMSFGIYNFKITEPAMEKLFSSDKFQKAGKETCPKDAQYVDPFQFNYIIQVPGQTVAAHIDAPYFWGANRFQYPQWLLAVMVFSGLFESAFVPQIQIVAYVHEWEPKDSKSGGSFIYWGGKNSNTSLSKSDAEGFLVTAESISPMPRAGVSVDGSKLVHAANTYRPEIEPPQIDRQKTPSLVYVKEIGLWELREDDRPIRNYTMDDLRISVVYRARCFSDKSKADEFRNQMYDKTKAMKLEDILSILVKDLQKKGKVDSNAMNMNRRDLALKLMDEYVRYPYSSDALIPLNYCALSRILPWSSSLLSIICKS